jgi:Zn-dependent protease with chaperone function
MVLAATYYDGKTSRRHQVTLEVQGDFALMLGELERRCPLSELHVSERSVHAQRKVTFPDGAYLEVGDSAAFDEMLARTGHQDGLVVRMTQSWLHVGMATVFTVAILWITYVYGIPAGARAVASALPQGVERSIGIGALELLDKRFFKPSALPATRQRELAERFAKMRPPQDGAPAYRLLFRASRIGPNALALPSGDVIMTDEMVKLAGDDEAVIAVLAHELGHLHERHLMQRLIQSSAIAAMSTLMFGDVSALLANVPTALLDARYSRQVESDADQYAVQMLRTNGISQDAMARVFERMARYEGKFDMGYLSTHPPSAERARAVRATPP